MQLKACLWFECMFPGIIADFVVICKVWCLHAKYQFRYSEVRLRSGSRWLSRWILVSTNQRIFALVVSLFRRCVTLLPRDCYQCVDLSQGWHTYVVAKAALVCDAYAFQKVLNSTYTGQYHCKNDCIFLTLPHQYVFSGQDWGKHCISYTVKQNLHKVIFFETDKINMIPCKKNSKHRSCAV